MVQLAPKDTCMDNPSSAKVSGGRWRGRAADTPEVAPDFVKPYRFSRRHLLKGGVAAAGLAGCPWTVQAAWRPERPIMLLNPLPPGGALDIQLRLLSRLVEPQLGVPLVIANRPGAGATLAGAAVAGAKADGNTLAVTLVNSLRYPYYVRTPWDPLKDFSYVCGLGSFVLGVITTPAARWKSIRELIDEGRRAPGRITYGTAGIGGSGHLIMLEVEQATGAQFHHVPYKGGPETQQALQAGELDFIVEGGNQLALAQSGVLKALALACDARFGALPGVPTFRELGIQVAGPSTYGIVGPAGLSTDTVSGLATAFLHASAQPEFYRLLSTQFAERWPLGAAEYGSWAEHYFSHVKPLLVRAGLAQP
jgi:tripartite-type tricarboxylate transporter receptor subunit TctC